MCNASCQQHVLVHCGQIMSPDTVMQVMLSICRQLFNISKDYAGDVIHIQRCLSKNVYTLYHHAVRRDAHCHSLGVWVPTSRWVWWRQTPHYSSTTLVIASGPQGYMIGCNACSGCQPTLTRGCCTIRPQRQHSPVASGERESYSLQ